MGKTRVYFLQLSFSENGCEMCDQDAAVSQCTWVPSKHKCNCEYCDYGEDDLMLRHFCARHAIEKGFALPASEVAAVCGYALEQLEAACGRRAVKSFEHEGAWYVLATEVVEDNERDVVV